MDYSLAAVKMFVADLKPAKPAKELASNGGAAFAIGSLIFQRVWLQGNLVPGTDNAGLALQDGTGVLPLQMGQESLKPGMYVLVVGAYLLGADGTPFLLVHKIVDLSSNPDRDTFWRLEVAEGCYQIEQNAILLSPEYEPPNRDLDCDAEIAALCGQL